MAAHLIPAWALGYIFWRFLVPWLRRGGLPVRYFLLAVGLRGLAYFYGIQAGLHHLPAPGWLQTSLALLLLTPPSLLPRAFFALGAYRCAGIAAYWALPQTLLPGERRLAPFFAGVAAFHHPGGWWARRAEAALARPGRPRRGVELTLFALQALQRQQLDEARALFGLVPGMSGALAQRLVRSFCQQFCLADAARRGNWQELLALGRRGPWSPTAAVLLQAARLRSGSSRWQRAWGWCGWMLMPQRTWGARLLRWAREQRPVQVPAPGAPLGERLSALAMLAAAPAGSLPALQLDQLATLVAGLHDDAAALVALRLRCAELGARAAAEDLLASTVEDARQALVSHLEHAWVPEPALGADARELLAEACDRSFDQIEHLRNLLCERHDDVLAAQGWALWLLWAKLRKRLELCWTLAPGRREALFETVVYSLVNLAADVWNEGSEQLLAHDIDRYLFACRKHTPSAELRTLIENNHKLMRAV